MKTTSITIGTPSTRTICSNAGVLPFAYTASRFNVAGLIDTEFIEHASPNHRHTIGTTMTALATALILGADDVSDIELLNPLVAAGLISAIPSDSTIYRRHQLLGDLDDYGASKYHQAMKQLRCAVWDTLGDHDPRVWASEDTPLIIDIDATEVTAHSDKENAAPTWKKHFGYHPLCAIIDLGGDLGGDVLAVNLRAGNAGSNTAVDHIQILDHALAALPDHSDGKPWAKRLVIRIDAGGGTSKFINYLDDQGFGYIIGFRATEAIGVIASTTGIDVKQHIIRRDGSLPDYDTGFVADITGRIATIPTTDVPPAGINLDNYPKGMRVIMKAEYPSGGAQLKITDVDGRRVRLCVTNLNGQVQKLDRLYSLRGRCEQRIKNLKDLGLGKLPHYKFGMNQAWIYAVMLAHNLITYTGLGDKAAGSTVTSWWVWEPKSLRARIISTAALVVHHARQTILKVDAHAPYRQLLTHMLTRQKHRIRS